MEGGEGRGGVGENVLYDNVSNAGSKYTDCQRRVKFQCQTGIWRTPGEILPHQGRDRAVLCAQSWGWQGERPGEVQAEDDGGGGEIHHGDLRSLSQHQRGQRVQCLVR